MLCERCGFQQNKVAHILRTNLNKEIYNNKKYIIMYFLHCRVHIYCLVLFPIHEEYMLPLSFVRKGVVVRVKDNDRFLSRLAFGNDFRRVLDDGSLFY